MKKKFLAFLVALLGVGLVSCDLGTSKYDPLPKELQNFTYSRFAQSIYNDVVNEAMELTTLQVNNPSGTTVPTGVVLTPTYNGELLTKLNIQFDIPNGYKGAMDLIYEGAPLAAGSSMKVVPSSLKYGDITITGDISVSFLAKGNYKSLINITVGGGALTDSYNSTLRFSCNFERKQTEGKDATTSNDDIFAYAGSFSGTYSDKTTYSSTIIDTLKFGYKSGYAKIGKVSQTPEMYPSPFFVEFGKGSYLNEVLFTFGDISKFYLI